MNTEAIAGQSMFGMHKGTQGIHLRLRLTACDKKIKKIKKYETSPLMSEISITKQSAWICFTACVVVTSDTMSSTLEFQSRAGGGKIELVRPLTIMLKLLLYTCQ